MPSVWQKKSVPQWQSLNSGNLNLAGGFWSYYSDEFLSENHGLEAGKRRGLPWVKRPVLKGLLWDIVTFKECKQKIKEMSYKIGRER